MSVNVCHGFQKAAAFKWKHLITSDQSQSVTRERASVICASTCVRSVKGLMGEHVWQGGGSQQYDTTVFNHLGENRMLCSWDAHAFCFFYEQLIKKKKVQDQLILQVTYTHEPNSLLLAVHIRVHVYCNACFANHLCNSKHSEGGQSSVNAHNRSSIPLCTCISVCSRLGPVIARAGWGDKTSSPV